VILRDGYFSDAFNCFTFWIENCWFQRVKYSTGLSCHNNKWSLIIIQEPRDQTTWQRVNEWSCVVKEKMTSVRSFE
jgi:hypothetical protein